MPARSVILQLQPGITQATLPDHRLMKPGIQYTVDWETFTKISDGARQNVVQVVAINGDTTTASGSFLPAQSSTGVNAQINLQGLLSTVSQSLTSFTIAGFAAQGYDAGGTQGAGTGVGIGITSPGSAANQVLTGPANERYQLVYNPSTNISGGQVTVWNDENNRFVTNARPTYTVLQDGQGTEYVASFTNTATTPATIGTKQGRFAGVALVNIPSGYYGWVQIEGICPAVSVSGAVTAGATLAVNAATAGTAKSQAATVKTVSGSVVTGTSLANNVFGTALTTAVSGTVAAEIRSGRAKRPYVRFLNKN